MKKIFIILMVSTMCALFLIGCMKKVETQDNKPADNDPNITTEQTTERVTQVQETQAEVVTEATTPVETEATQGTQNLTDSGSYVGRADNNFIEIKISGVPEENASKVFMLSEEVRTNFDSYNLQTGEAIQFDYATNEDGQTIIYRIKRI